MSKKNLYVGVNIPRDREIAEQRIPNYWEGLASYTPYKVINDYEKLVNGRSVHFFLIVDGKSGLFREIPADSAYVMSDAEEREYGHLNG